ncbi:MAG: hypothetical protein ABIP39_14055 [Polyangiaceae bacterium]
MRNTLFFQGIAGLFAVAIATSANAYCPSYTPAGTAGGQNCGVIPALGTNPDIATWQTIFAKVGGGQASWGTDGPNIGTMGSGCAHPVATHDVPAHFPCHVLQAIAMQESGWVQFCKPDTPASEVGKPERTIVAFDCGYGVGQVTSGMHVGETPSFDRARVASDPTYNLATGTLILLAKWSGTSCVGDNNPDLVEDWYTAVWAYNGLAYSNNPNNPNLTAGRGPYDPNKGGSYTYQERVFGWMEHPPGGRWPVLAPAYPNRGDIGSTGSPPALPEPSCASPTSCTTKRMTHVSPCGMNAGDAGPDAAVVADSGPMMPPVGDDGGGPINSVQVDASGSGGCGCRTAPSRSSNVGAGSLFALALTFARRRRATAGERARRSARR